jgi:hypothetical protein
MGDRVHESCEFHFKMDNLMKGDLKSLPGYKDSGNLSRYIVDILKLLYGKIENEHFFGEQRKSKYLYINDDFNVQRESVHVYLPQGMYMQLKMMHHNLNFYSIAQLVRGFLGFYIDLVKKYGDKLEEKFKELIAEWEKENDSKRLSNELVRQLLRYLQEKHENFVLLGVYNALFSPISIYRL